MILYTSEDAPKDIFKDVGDTTKYGKSITLIK